MWAASSDVRTVMMSPLNFLRNPMTWLDQIDEYEVAATLCPSFVLHQFNRLLALGVPVDADLRTLRHLIVGAEPISASEARQFISGLESAALRPDSFHACFGLAEMSLLATSKPGGLVTRHIAASPQSEPVEVVSLGRPVGTTSCEVDKPPTGRLSVNSTSQTVWTSKLGFIDESAAIQTGDLATIIDDELYVFGRWDDTLNVNGQLFSASVLESAARGVAGANEAAVVRINGPDGPICAVVEVDPEARLMPASIQEAIARATGVMVSTVVPVHRLPRTSSGKVRRVQVRDQLEQSTHVSPVGEDD